MYQNVGAATGTDKESVSKGLCNFWLTLYIKYLSLDSFTSMPTMTQNYHKIQHTTKLTASQFPHTKQNLKLI